MDGIRRRLARGAAVLLLLQTAGADVAFAQPPPPISPSPAETVEPAPERPRPTTTTSPSPTTLQDPIDETTERATPYDPSLPERPAVLAFVDGPVVEVVPTPASEPGELAVRVVVDLTDTAASFGWAKSGAMITLFEDRDRDGIGDDANRNEVITIADQVRTMRTKPNGDAVFTDLDAGAYVAVIGESAFEAGGELEGYEPGNTAIPPAAAATTGRQPAAMTTATVEVTAGERSAATLVLTPAG